MTKRLSIVSLAPLVASLVVVAIGVLLPDATPRVWFYAATAETAKLLAFVGCAVAARAFDRGDYLSRAWWLVGCGFLPLVLKDLLPGGGPWLPVGAAVWGIARALLSLAGNGLSVVGLWLLARASRVAGLEPPGSAGGRRALVTLGAVLAVGLVAPGLWSDAHTASVQNPGSLINVVSDVGDVISFLLVVPVLLTALSLRGGRLVWPWLLLTLGSIAWLVYDAPTAFAVLSGRMTPVLRHLGEGARTAACLYYVAAGVAQRWALSSTDRYG